MSLIQAQGRFIERIMAIREPGPRACGAMYARSYRAAVRELRRYLGSIGIEDAAQQDAIIKDARDMARLNKLCEE